MPVKDRAGRVIGFEKLNLLGAGVYRFIGGDDV
jgi:hypothetical protein